MKPAFVSKWKKRLAGAFAGLLAFSLAVPFANPAASAAGYLNGKVFGDPVELAQPIQTVSLNDAVIGIEDGRPTLYTTASGSGDAVFNVVDVESNTLLRYFVLSGVNQSWRHAIAPDGTVYIAAINAGNTPSLWKYSPDTKQVANLGNPSPGDKSLWSMTTDDAGNVYVGTYDTGRVVRYDPQTNQYHDYGPVSPGRDYVRSMAYHDGYIYAGTGTIGQVVKLNVATGDREVISDPLTDILGVASASDIPFAYDMAVVDKYLVVRFDGPQYALTFYDLEQQQWVNVKIAQTIKDKDGNDFTEIGAFGFNQLPARNGKIYATVNRQIAEIDLTTFEARSTGISFGSALRGAAWVDFGDGPRYVTITSNGKIVFLDVDNGTRVDRDPVVRGSGGIPLHQLETASDGRIYMSGYPGGTAAAYNPKTGQIVTFGLGQAEGMVELDGYMYYGIYPGGYIYRSKISDATPAPELVFQIGDEQDRPYMMTTGDGKLFIGTIPDYGKRGGALTVYDPQSGEHRTYRNIVSDHSITGLLYMDGLIIGGTNINGGTNTTPAAGDYAKLFVWDVAEEQKVKEIDLKTFIPALDKPQMITGLTLGPDGNIWGNVDGIVFRMDPDTHQVIDYKNIYPNVKNYGYWRPYHPRWGKDGMLYVDLADIVTVIDPATMQHAQLTPGGKEIAFMTIAEGADGMEHIYYNDGAKLFMIPVSVGEPPEPPAPPQLNVYNGSFEEPVSGGNIPGWSFFFSDLTPNVSFSVSTEMAYSGTHSLKVVDNSADEPIAVVSDPIPVLPGETYTASVQMFVQQGRGSLLARFYDANGAQVGDDMLYHQQTATSGWLQVTVSGTAPANAKTIRVFASIPKLWTGTIYYDDFHVAGKFPEADPSPGEFRLEAASTTVAEGEDLAVKVGVADAKDLYGVNVEITYDADVFDVKSVAAGQTFADGYFTYDADTPGIIRFIASHIGENATSGDAEAAVLTFTAKKTAAASAIALTTASQLVKIDADVTSDIFSPESDIVLQVKVVKEYADVNGDGKVDILDLVAVAKRVGGAYDEQYDVNRDNAIDIQDVSIVALKLLK